MTPTPHRRRPEITVYGKRRPRLRIPQLVFTAAATLAVLSLFDAASPEKAQTQPGSVRLTAAAVDLPASPGPPFSPYAQTRPGVVGTGGFATDGNDDQAEQQAQLQEQQAQQQAQQQAEQQNEEAQQQAQQAEQQGQWVEDHPGP
ncbi:hypothetical protein [Mycobacterium sp. 852002-51057_SCH5723018]|uniref:hypothetical protein n=1 Tax=Mycobacterium sp. 852002-51057_SCH5723018 TaxID=1834094 RepID=UPI000B1FBA61|nr:hypothetical protein [Mycobacterium sp. 852002-51057_SCH5723018]